MQIDLVVGDITKLSVDAIVNAANCGLLGGGGVDGAIHRAAGPQLLQECRELVGRLPGQRGQTGEAYLTGAGRLPCRFVIHTPGPVWRGGQRREAELLAASYANSLRRSEEAGCASIAFPCISTGVYGFPKEPAAHIALRTIREFPAQSVRRVVLCCFSQQDAEVYRPLLE